MNKDELNKLREKILKFNSAYEKGKPLVEDSVYDFYKKKLSILEKKEKNKISDYIGSKVEVPLPHLYPILSLNHEFGKDSIVRFLKKIEKHVNPFPLIGELKIDGVSVVARYENGVVQTLKTRGDGLLGENISHLIPFLDIPNSIFLNELVEIRFEAYFEKDVVKNPRNAAAGILLKKNPDSNLGLLKFAPHNLYSKEKIWNTYLDLRKLFEKMHLNPIQPYSICHSLEDCQNYFEKINNIKENLNHEIDGVVFKINSKEDQDKLGNTAKSPRFSFAIKFSNSFNVTEIKKIEFQVGRQGKVTPLAIISPVVIGNRTISKATLNNLNDLEKKGYSIRDIVKIEMAGEVIPKITEIIEKSPKVNKIPTKCPSCKTELVNDFCPNGWNCFEQKLSKLIYFASKPCLNIKNIANNQIEFFTKEGILNFPFDFFELKRNIKKISYSPTWLAEKSFKNLVKNIEKSAYTTLDKFITSLGITNVGSSKALEIANHFKTFENFLNSKTEDLFFLGENNAKSIFDYIQKEKNWILKTYKYIKIDQEYKEYSIFDFT